MILPGSPRPMMDGGVPIIDIPAMTSNTTPAGWVASASSVLNSSYAAWRAFDHNLASGWNSASGTQNNAWVQLKGPQQFRVTGYEITGGGNQERPSAFELLGSDDGVAFTSLDVRTGISWTGFNETKQFSVASPELFSIYRLHVSAMFDPGSLAVTFKELSFLQG